MNEVYERFQTALYGRRLNESSDEASKESKLEAEYEDMCQNASKYVEIQGMFEVKDRFRYDPYRDINEDIYTWKRYGTNMTKNQQGINEI